MTMQVQVCSVCNNFSVESLDVSLHQDITRPRRARAARGSGFLAISHNERKRLDSVEKSEKLLRQKISDMEWENIQLNQTLNGMCDENKRLVNAVTRMQMQQKEKNDKMKQLEMIIDMLNMRIRYYEAKLDRLSKKFFTIIKEE